MKEVKNIKSLHLLFYLSFIAVIIITIFFERKLLVYALPINIISLAILYIKSVHNINFWYLLSLLVILITDILIYTDFAEHFSVICLLICLYFLICSISIRKFIVLSKFQWSPILSFPFLICTFLITYLIFAISQLLLPFIIPALPYLIISLIGSLTFVITSYIIYNTDRYQDAFKLLAVIGLSTFVVALLPINELFYYNKVFTVLINIAHILGLYIFMGFLIKAKPENITTKKRKYL